MTFEFNARQLFLTYPKCTLSKESVLQTLQSLTEVENYTIAKEKHADQTDHIHALLRFKKRYHTKNARAFDIQDFHPNIKKVKTTADFKRVDDYVRKDRDFITNVKDSLSPSELLGKRILEEGITPSLIYENPSIVFKNFHSIRSWHTIYRSNPSPPISKQKKCHIWLHGKSNTGKTSWFRNFKELFVCKELPENNDYSHFTPEIEIAYADEYRGHLTVQQLNKICDGYTRLNTKGGSFDLERVLVIIISNYSISDVYKNCSVEILETLHNRFIQYDASIALPKYPTYSIKL